MSDQRTTDEAAHVAAMLAAKAAEISVVSHVGYQETLAALMDAAGYVPRARLAAAEAEVERERANHYETRMALADVTNRWECTDSKRSAAEARVAELERKLDAQQHLAGARWVALVAAEARVAVLEGERDVREQALGMVRQLRDDMTQVCQVVGLDGVTSDFLFKLNRIVDEKYGLVAQASVPAQGFVGPLEVGDWRCPICGDDPADPTLHAEGCPTIGTPAQHDEALAGVGSTTNSPDKTDGDAAPDSTDEDGLPQTVEMSTEQILRKWRPGSHDWSWDEEFNDLRINPDHSAVTRAVRRRVESEGIGFADGFAPILLGSDGRVWDGHHRLCIAVALGIKTLRVEVVGEGTPNPSDERACEACGGAGVVECWNPGGPCPTPNEPDCETCGPCVSCRPVAGEGSDQDEPQESIVCFDYPDCDRPHAGGAGGVPVHPPVGARISGDEPLIPDEPVRGSHDVPARGEFKPHVSVGETFIPLRPAADVPEGGKR